MWALNISTLYSLGQSESKRHVETGCKVWLAVVLLSNIKRESDRV